MIKIVKASLYKKTSKYAYFYDREKKERAVLKLYKGIQVYSYNKTSMAHDAIKKYLSYPVEVEIKNFDMNHATEISYKICKSKYNFEEFPVKVKYDNKRTQTPFNAINIAFKNIFHKL